MSAAGQPRRMATYTVAGEQREIVAQRIGGRVAVSDRPVDVDGPGRVYLIERHIESAAALDGLVAAYVARSEFCGRPAMIEQRHVLEDVLWAA